MVLLATDGEMRVHADLLRLLDGLLAEIAGVGRVRYRRRLAIGPRRPLDACRVQIVQRRLRHRDGLLLVIRLVGHFRCYDDLFLRCPPPLERCTK